VITDGAASDARLTATWMYGDQGVSEADEMLSSSGGTNVSEFHISKETPWPTGSYRVDVKLNGQTVGTREFRIQ
jgi:outer membrane usher protein FimD/PapC